MVKMVILHGDTVHFKEQIDTHLVLYEYFWQHKTDLK